MAVPIHPDSRLAEYAPGAMTGALDAGATTRELARVRGALADAAPVMARLGITFDAERDDPLALETRALVMRADANALLDLAVALAEARYFAVWPQSA